MLFDLKRRLLRSRKLTTPRLTAGRRDVPHQGNRDRYFPRGVHEPNAGSSERGVHYGAADAGRREACPPPGEARHPHGSAFFVGTVFVSVNNIHAHHSIQIATGSKSDNYKIKTAHLDFLFKPFGTRVICGDDPILEGKGKPGQSSRISYLKRATDALLCRQTPRSSSRPRRCSGSRHRRAGRGLDLSRLQPIPTGMYL